MTEPTLDSYLDEHDLARSLRDDVRGGLTADPKWLPPKWFYDARGSALFEEITELPEYYPTRAERAVLRARAGDIARITNAKTLIELGSGSSEKTRLLLDALRAHGTLGAFVPLDVSGTALRDALAGIAADYPGLDVHGIVGDFTRHLGHLPGGGTRLVAFLGGTIGNLLPAERAAFLAELRAALEPGDWLLLGTDLVKDPAVLVAAYDDATRSPSGSRCGCGRRGRCGSGYRPSASPSTSPRARSCVPRSPRSSAAPASTRSSPRPGSPPGAGGPTRPGGSRSPSPRRSRRGDAPAPGRWSGMVER